MSTFIRWSGVAVILAGLFTLVNSFLRDIYSTNLPTTYMVARIVSTIIAFAGIYAYQREAGGLWNLLGVLLGIAGNGLFFLDDFRLGGALYAFGLLFIGIAGLRSGAFPRWVPVLWIATMFVGMPAFFLDALRELLFGLATLLLTTAFVGAGYTMWSSPATATRYAT